MVRLLRRVVVASGLVALASACSDPVPPSAQGTGAVNIAGKMCPKTGFVQFANGAVNGTTHQSLVDGTAGAQVSCAVTASAGGFQVSGRIIAPTADGTTAVLSVSNLLVNPNNPTSTGSFSAQVFGGGLSISDDMCEFSVAPSSTDTALAIGAGRVWMSMRCTNALVSGDASGATCQIASGDAPGGYFVFENCDQ